MTHYFANVLYLSICMLGNCSCFYYLLLNVFKIKFLKKKKKTPQDHHQSVKQFGSRSRPTFCWSSSGFKLFAKGYWQTTKLSTGMQRVIAGKYFSVQYIVSCRDIHAYVYHKYSDTLKRFNMLCPLNKAKVIFKGSSSNQFYFPMLNGTLSFLQKYLFLLLSFQFCIIYGTCSQKSIGNF